MTKFLKIIWSINGVVFLIFFLILGFLMIKDLLRNFAHEDNPRVIVGEELKKAKDAGLILQGIEYDTPMKIYGSNKYFMAVRIKTYNTPKRSNAPSFVGGDSREKLMVDATYYSSTVNIAFLDENFQVTHSLIDKKAFISSFNYPAESGTRYRSEQVDSSIHFMTYKIAFEDSDQNGTINEDDNTDLYISSKEGKDLRQVTAGVDIATYEFVTSDKILIAYFKRDEQPTEHKKKYLAMYKVKEKKLEELTSIDKELIKIEETLTK